MKHDAKLDNNQNPIQNLFKFSLSFGFKYILAYNPYITHVYAWMHLKISTFF